MPGIYKINAFLLHDHKWPDARSSIRIIEQAESFVAEALKAAKSQCSPYIA
jgi:hypothetical protein